MQKRVGFPALRAWGAGLLPAVLLGAGLGIAGCGSKQASPQAAGPPQMPPPPVTVVQAIAQDVPVYLDEIGKSQAIESVTVTPQVAGRITERLFEDGAQLQKDQPLFTIDPRPYQAQLDAAQAQLAQSRAALDLANTQLKMYESIVGTKAVSELDYDTKKNTVELDQAQVQAAEAAVENAKLNLEYCHIRSPIGWARGRASGGRRKRCAGEHDGAVVIERVDPIYANFTITESDLAEVRREMALRAR